MPRSAWYAGVAGVLFALTNVGAAGALPSCSLRVAGDRLVLKHDGFGLPVSLQSPRFVIAARSVRPASVAYRHGEIESASGMEVRFAPRRIGGGGELEVRLFVRWSAEEGVLRKWASYRLVGGAPRVMEEVVLDEISLGAGGARLTPEQPVVQPPYSYPVFLEGFFFAGVEYPVAATRIEGQRVILGHRPGIVLQPGVWHETRKAVYGAAAAGGERLAFARYIEAHRPQPTGFFTSYNHWWSTPVMASEPDIERLMGLIEEGMVKPYGVHFDTFCIDVGWPEPRSIWGMNRTDFPDGFDRIRKLAAGMGTELGIWVSPSSVYSQATDLQWAMDNGYEASPVPQTEGGLAFACLGGARYQREFKRRVAEMVSQYHLGSIKFDGYIPECTATDHGHQPGALSAEAIAEGMIDVFAAARKADPEIWLRPTCFGWNPSPWWLFYTNSVLGCHGDDAPWGRVPSPVYTESYTSARDYYHFLVHASFRSAVPADAVEELGITHQTREPLMNDAVVVVTRGGLFTPLYVNPALLSETQWRQLAGVLRWARGNAELLGNTEEILPASWRARELPPYADPGPMPREPYGYAHWQGERGLVTLRNPWVAPQTLNLRIGSAEATHSGGARLSAVSLYPEPRLYGSGLKLGDTLEVRLAPYETVVLSIGPEQSVKGLADVSGAARRYVAATVTRQTLRRAQFDTTQPALGPSWTSLVGDAPSALRLGLEADIAVEAPSAQLLVLLEGPGALTAPVGQLTIDGAETKWEESSSETGWASTMAAVPERWLFLKAPLPQGRSAVSLELLGAGDSTRVSAWVWATKPGGQDVGYPNALPSPETVSLYSIPLLEQTDAAAVETGPALVERPSARIDGVFLDALEPTETHQGWGTLQRNLSVWEKPLTIAGKRYVRGLGISSQSRIVYALEGKYRRFQCWVGADGATTPSVVFVVSVDGKQVWESGTMRRDDPAQWVDVDVTGARALALEVGDSGDGIVADHADWADARVLR